jgi:nicotinamide-nucleotide amidase
MKVEVVSIGTELLMSDVLDTNSAYISRSLQTVGAELIYKVTVGDNLERITEAFLVALDRADVVFAIGGLGTAVNDFTRAAAAAATGLEYDPDENIVIGATPIDVMPRYSTPFFIDQNDRLLFCLPGNRREMAYILETAVFPYLQRQRQLKSGWVLLRTVGLMESNIREMLSDLASEPNQKLSFDSYAGQTNIRLTVEADSEREIEEQLTNLNHQVRSRLGDHIYGEGNDRLEAAILNMLHLNSLKLAVIECNTSRFLTRALVQVPNYGTVVETFPFDQIEDLAAHLNVPVLTAQDEFTRWCRHVTELFRLKQKTDLSLFLYQQASPGGVQLSSFLSSAQGVSVTQRSFGGHPENINQWAATLGLSHLHRWLLAHAVSSSTP